MYSIVRFEMSSNGRPPEAKDKETVVEEAAPRPSSGMGRVKSLNQTILQPLVDIIVKIQSENTENRNRKKH